jgi:ABC-type glutathione transport system ATPase component
MDLGKIVSELKSERDRLDRAIGALQAIGSGKSTVSASVRGSKRRHHLTAEGRRRLSQMMKKRWAERRKAKLVRKLNNKAA